MSSDDEAVPSSHVMNEARLALMAEFAASKIAELNESGELCSDMLKPMEVTKPVKKKISKLPKSQQVWLVHSIVNYIPPDGDCPRGGEYKIHACVARVVKEHGSNGLRWQDSDGLARDELARVEHLSPSQQPKNQCEAMLGAIAQACLEPLKVLKLLFGDSDVATKCSVDAYAKRPKKILFASLGSLQLLEPDLREMGIKKLGVAEQALTTSVALDFEDKHCARSRSEAKADDIAGNSSLLMKQFRLMDSIEGNQRYVSESRIPLQGWEPDDDEMRRLPMSWWARPPRPGSYNDLNELWGWRTNLERAVAANDVAKIQEISESRSRDAVREFCECRFLLIKEARKGNVEGCRALLEYCHVSVEGLGDPDFPLNWRKILADEPRTSRMTTLQHAASCGHAEVVKLLVSEFGASVNIQSEFDATALHHAVSRGHLDCVRVLCEHGADHSLLGVNQHTALQQSESLGKRAGSTAEAAMQQNVRLILREYDPRCSYCQATVPCGSAPGPASMLNCPCKKERYCNTHCQRKRWKEHKAYHNHVMGVRN